MGLFDAFKKKEEKCVCTKASFDHEILEASLTQSYKLNSSVIRAKTGKEFLVLKIRAKNISEPKCRIVGNESGVLSTYNYALTPKAKIVAFAGFLSEGKLQGVGLPNGDEMVFDVVFESEKAKKFDLQLVDDGKVMHSFPISFK